MKTDGFTLKLSILFFIAAACFFVLCGCAKVEYIRIVYSDDVIQERVVVELDVVKMRSKGVPDSTMYQLREQIRTDLDKNFINDYRLFLEYVKSAPENVYTNAQKNMIKEGLHIENADYNNNVITAEVIFDSYYIYKAYISWVYGELGIEIEEENEDATYPVVENSFFKKYIFSTGESVFNNLQTKFPGLYDKYANQIPEAYGLKQFALNDVSFSQIYGSPNMAIRSNANVVEIYGDLKLHQWDVNVFDPNYKMEFYGIAPNAINWYVMALAATIMIILVLYIYKHFKFSKLEILETSRINRSIKGVRPTRTSSVLVTREMTKGVFDQEVINNCEELFANERIKKEKCNAAVKAAIEVENKKPCKLKIVKHDKNKEDFSLTQTKKNKRNKKD